MEGSELLIRTLIGAVIFMCIGGFLHQKWLAGQRRREIRLINAAGQQVMALAKAKAERDSALAKLKIAEQQAAYRAKEIERLSGLDDTITSLLERCEEAEMHRDEARAAKDETLRRLVTLEAEPK